MKPTNNPDVEAIVRRVVEGQIRSFLHDHPEVCAGVTRHAGVGKTRAEWITNSLAKRIVRDLASDTTVNRLVALLAGSTGGATKSAVALKSLPPAEIAAGMTAGSKGLELSTEPREAGSVERATALPLTPYSGDKP